MHMARHQAVGPDLGFLLPGCLGLQLHVGPVIIGPENTFARRLPRWVTR
jgi:hypothetical protein